jgi:dihydropyrimidinase
VTPWSIYEGWDVTGWPVMTIVRGNIVMEWPDNTPRAKVTDASPGQYLRRMIGGTP